MQRKLTITVDEQVYLGLHEVIGRRKISHFIESLVRPHILKKELDASYLEMSRDEKRESDALDWSEGTMMDFSDEKR